MGVLGCTEGQDEGGYTGGMKVGTRGVALVLDTARCSGLSGETRAGSSQELRKLALSSLVPDSSRSRQCFPWTSPADLGGHALLARSPSRLTA